MRALSAEDLQAVAAAVGKAGRKLSPEDRWDLRQELSIKLAQREAPESLAGALAKWAHDAVGDLCRSRDAEKLALRGAHVNRAGVPYRKGESWRPSWYAPSKGAGPYNPFACRGARIMTVKDSVDTSSDFENEMIEFLDSTRFFHRLRQARAARKA